MKIRAIKREVRNESQACFSAGLDPVILDFGFRASIILCAIFLILVGPVFAHAEAPRRVEISPAIIDKKVKQRDIIRASITLKNIGDRPLKLFPSVEDVNPENGDQYFNYGGNAEERSDSLANWIELSRGVVELAPGETKTLPFVIHVNMNAVPGTYHSQLNFIDGGTRDETLDKVPDGYVSVNVEVQADIKEDLQLVKFSTDRVAFSGDDVLFNYHVQNIGNQELQPAGDIRVYDRRGQEVATIDVNKDGKTIAPEQTSQMASAWSAVNGFGQYKALITVNYGKGQTASVQDTVFFWIIPWKQMLGLTVATLIAITVLALYFRRWFEEQHLNKLALAGVLKTHPSAVPAYIPPFPVPATPPRRPLEPKPEVHKLPEAPKERLILKVVENVVIAWRLFTTFKQRGRITPQDIVQEKESVKPKSAPEPQHQPAPKSYVSHQVPGVQVVWHSWGHDDRQGHGETIDLKKMRTTPHEPLHEGHTVNLKKQI
jgi:hypothetical protein